MTWLLLASTSTVLVGMLIGLAVLTSAARRLHAVKPLALQVIATARPAAGHQSELDR